MGYIIQKSDTVNGGSVMDAALDAQALFEPQVTGTLLPNGTASENTFTVYREYADGSQVVLNAGVKSGYHAGSYTQLVTTADAMFPDSCTSLTVLNDGARLMFTQQIGEEHTFADGDTIINNLMYTASLNSTWSTAIYGFSFRPFCTNQIPNGLVQLSQKRTRNHDSLLFQKAQVLAKSIDAFERFMGDVTMLKSVQVNESGLRRLLDEVAPLITDEEAAPKAVNHAENRRNAIRYFFAEESDKFGANAWSFYNAVQSYEFHTATKDKVEKQAEVIRQPDKKQSLTLKAQGLLMAMA